MTPEISSRVATIRAKVLAGTVTREELAEAIQMLREGRVGAAIASDTARRKRAKAEIPAADDLLKEMEGL